MLQLSRASASSALAAPLTAAPRRSLRTPRAAPCTSSLEGLTFAQRCRSAAAAATLAAALTCAPLEGQAHAAAAIQADVPVLDLARVVPASQLEPLQQQLRQLEAETGWRVRMLTRFSGDGPSVEEIRAGWKTDDRTVVVFVDPSSPNIMSFKWGQAVQQLLPRQFFTELQSRYGNLFNVREQGESAAVLSAMDAITVCLRRPGGCAVVPGLSEDHYFFTLATSVAGGVIAGAAAKLQPSGFVQRRWVWVALFAPLWGSLWVSFGLGPILTRTDDLLPIAANCAAFAATAAVVGFSPAIGRAVGLSVDEADS